MSTVWSEYSKTYEEVDEETGLGYERKLCERCDSKYYEFDSHGIEGCIRSLADRVKLLFEGKKP